MRYLLLLLLAGCIDSSMDTEVNTVVYQFTSITVGDTIPGLVVVWSRGDANNVIGAVDEMRFSRHPSIRLSDCVRVHLRHREHCYGEREAALLATRDRYIRELQILGFR